MAAPWTRRTARRELKVTLLRTVFVAVPFPEISVPAGRDGPRFRRRIVPFCRATGSRVLG
jgi:hypothetical protein